jgi:hypothetical protein
MRLFISAALALFMLGIMGRANADTPSIGPNAGATTDASIQSSGDPLSNLTLSAGASAWSGDYGAKTNTDIDAVLLGARYKIGDLRLTASAPWMRIDSAGAIFTGIEGTPLIVAPKANAAKTTREGIGDLTLGAAYSLPSASIAGLDVDIFGRIKLPTASRESDLSSRKADYAGGFELSKSWGRIVPFASVSYRSFGDSGGWKLKDGVATSVGTSIILSDRLVGVFSYDYAQRASQFVQDSHEISAGLSARLPHNLRLTGFAAGGLSNGAAAISGGLSLSLAL